MINQFFKKIHFQMPIEKEILSKFTCCFLNDDHIAIEPILVSCGAIGCKECIRSSKTEEIECFSCKEKHKTNDLKNMPGVKAMEDIMTGRLWRINGE